MQESEKLRILLPHWIEHNQEHAAEFQMWAEKAGQAAPEILAAAEMMVKANFTLEAALEKLGGPLEYNHTH